MDSAQAGPADDRSLPQGVRSTSEWFELLYHELRRRARGQIFRYHALSMGATTLLHEAWLKLADRPLEFATQAELVAYAGHTMRSIVINHIRDRQTEKRGGEIEFVPYDTLHDLRAMEDVDVVRLDDALRDLERVDSSLAQLIELHFFAGLSFVELAALQGVSERTLRRNWDKARMLLSAALRN
jgi:RNA polymerase sigma factor (TIGR02999 family)